MLQLWHAEGAFTAIEEYLREEAFFSARRCFADLYLGYGLSSTLRREMQPDPPESAALPLAACRIRRLDEMPGPAGAFAIGDWERTWKDEEYAAAISAVRAAIRRGDVYQVNLVQHLSAPFDGDPAGLAERLASLHPLQPDPFVGDGWTIVSASPELFLARRGHRVWTAPIKGTRPLEEDDLRSPRRTPPST
jgi:para-aminobenzoate synthetase component 1